MGYLTANGFYIEDDHLHYDNCYEVDEATTAWAKEVLRLDVIDEAHVAAAAKFQLQVERVIENLGMDGAYEIFHDTAQTYES
jgi:hypothetical protein